MSGTTKLKQTLAPYTDRLFGAECPPSNLRIAPLSLGTRGIYQVRGPRGAPTLVAKVRSSNSKNAHEAVLIQTLHEHAVLSAVWTAFNSSEMRSHHGVPRPVLALPESGLLVMEQVHAEPIKHLLWRWMVGLRSRADVSGSVLRCGQWLHTYAEVASAIKWPVISPEQSRILSASRVHHHVYRLIGLRGGELGEALVEGATRRLTAWRIDSELLQRIETGMSRQLAGFDSAHDAAGPVHGKYSIADVFIREDNVYAIDLEQAGEGSRYLDVAYFLFQLYMVTRWRPFKGTKALVAELRESFLKGRAFARNLDHSILDVFIAYYMVNSLRPGGGLAGSSARSYAHQWIELWLNRIAPRNQRTAHAATYASQQKTSCGPARGISRDSARSSTERLEEPPVL